jgi:hypothetical protein
MVEADVDKFRSLVRNYRNLPGVALVNEKVSSSGATCIPRLLETYAPGEPLDPNP